MAVDNLTLARWRDLEALSVLRAFADYLKQDQEYRARGPQNSSRWFAQVAGQDFEFLCTGPKFLDTRANKGGGGAIDLVMHMHRVSFKGAVALLRDKGV